MNMIMTIIKNTHGVFTVSQFNLCKDFVFRKYHLI